MASGKGAAAAYLHTRYHAKTFRFSTILRDLVQRLNVAEVRENLVAMSEAIRHAFGEDILAKTMAHDANQDDCALIVVEGIRREADITHLKKLPYFILVSIDADLRTRYERLVTRNENADDHTKTWEAFLADHERSTERTIPSVIALAQEHINNNGTREDLERALDMLVLKYVGTP